MIQMEKELVVRSSGVCELCGGTEDLAAYALQPAREGAEGHVWACGACRGQIEAPETVDANHWRCLNDCMWSPVPAVQALAWRMLDRLRGEGWPADLLEMMYMDEETAAWARAESGAVVHLDAFGNVLQAGDTVVLTQSLNVKGSSLTAKRGTSVRNISLVHDNAEQIEGRVEGQRIVILTKYVKKAK